MESGTRLGPYEILEQLGAGGMGEVYLARDSNLDRDVAIKVLPEVLAADENRLVRLQREARALAALNHPGIATVHDLGEQDGVAFIVMELIEGDTLSDRLRDGALGLTETLEIASQVARALEAAHGRGIIHRDLKPDNIKITPDGRVKVLDFGLAKRQVVEPRADSQSDIRTDVGATATGVVMGTPPYMSPEQIRAGNVDERTDVWAFGCVLYEMLTGKRAFGLETPSDTLAAVLTAAPDMSRLPADLPELVRGMLRGTLTKELDRRLSSMRDVGVALEAARQGVESGDYVRAGSPSRSTSNRSGMMFAAVALLATALGVGWYYLAPEGPRIAPRPADDAGGSVAVLPFESIGQADPTMFTEGVHVDMLTRLSRLPDLRVTSRTSVMQYRDAARSLPEIGTELGVAWVLLGEVQEVGGQVQVNARLVNVAQDRQVWAESYRRELTAENLFDIQSEIVEQIATQLHAQLSPTALDAMSERPTVDLDAYRLYVQGRALLANRANADMRRAIDYFKEAIALDSGYALAWAGMAEAYALLESYGYASEEDLTVLGLEAVDRALELDPSLAEAHASRGLLQSEVEGVPPHEPFLSLRRAAEMRPSYAEAHNWMAWGYLLNGYAARAFASASQAVELDPLSLEALSNLGLAHIAMGRYDDGLTACERLTELGPGFDTGPFYEAIARVHVGDEVGAIGLLAGLEIPWAGDGPQVTLAVAHARAGNDAAARELLTVIEGTGDPFDAGLIHAALGDYDEAWIWFGQIEGWTAWTRLAAHFLFPDELGPVRADARWDQLTASIANQLD